MLYVFSWLLLPTLLALFSNLLELHSSHLNHTHSSHFFEERFKYEFDLISNYLFILLGFESWETKLAELIVDTNGDQIELYQIIEWQK